MSENKCNFCSKEFHNKYNLIKHQNTAKYCLEFQNKNIVANYTCRYCLKNFTLKHNLNSHELTCKEKEEKNTAELIEENKKLKDEINSVKDKNKKINLENKNRKDNIDQLQKEISILKSENSKCKQDHSCYEFLIRQVEEQKNRILELEDKMITSIKSVATKAIENTGNKVINTVYKNKFIQNLIPLTDDHIKEQSKNLELKHIIDGPDSLAIFAKQNALKDRVICTDVTRRNFIFKDESGNIIKDPKGVKITKKFVDNNKEELLRLLKAYVLTYYDDDTIMSLKEKQEMEELMFAIKYSNNPDNADSYNNFEKQFTVCFSKLVYNKQYENLETE
jgi:hypothetical protein